MLGAGLFAAGRCDGDEPFLRNNRVVDGFALSRK